MKRDVGKCDKCRRSFDYQIIHNGFNDTAYAYCDLCGTTMFVGGWDDTRQPAGAPLRIHGPIQPETEKWLQRCTCGGCFRHDAAPRCPHCREPLSAEFATSYIEANAEGTRGGWRWQQSWSGIYCLVIAGRLTKNVWREPADLGGSADQAEPPSPATPRQYDEIRKQAPGSRIRRAMRILLRAIALLCALSVLSTAVFVAQLDSRRIAALYATGTFGVVTLLGWLITFIAGPIAAVQLFRLKQSGRIAGSILFGTMLMYYLAGLLAFRQPGVSRAPILALATFLGLLLAILWSPLAKQTCSWTRSGSPVAGT